MCTANRLAYFPLALNNFQRLGLARMQREQSRMSGRSPPPHRHAELQPIADLFGPLSQVRMRTASSGQSGSRGRRLAASGSEQLRFSTQTCRGARRGTGGDIDLHANHHAQDDGDDDVVGKLRLKPASLHLPPRDDSPVVTVLKTPLPLCSTHVDTVTPRCHFAILTSTL